MNASLITLAALVALFLGYRFYARFLARNVFKTEGDIPPESMPSEEFRDDTDFVPTKKHVLFGHHFSSIAGAAPILGPAIAITWGWLPALLWVVLGSIFMGAVHDYGALVISVRHKGKSIGSIAEDIIGKRTRYLFLTIIFLLVFIVIAVFAFAIASLFVLYPGTVIPINFEIIVAILIGFYVKKGKGGLLIPSILALIALYVMTYVGWQYPVVLPEFLHIGGSPLMTWVLFLMLYGFIAASLPVWMLLQPRDYINSHQLFVGLALIYLGLFIAQPTMDAPALNVENPANPLSWFPFLFITIACGAISGFHSLVSSGTTSKQLSRIQDARFIGYGGMIGEASLAVLATIAVGAGFLNSEAWHAHYSNFAEANKLPNKIEAFVEGCAGFLDVLGLPHELAAVFVSVMVISFAATSLDTAIRIQRYVVGEIGEGLKIRPVAKNIWLQSFIAVGLSFLLVLSDGGAEGKGGLALWPLFGSTNQMIGSLALLVISVWLLKLKRNYWFTLIPMILVTAVTFIGTIQNFQNYLAQENWLLVFMALVIAGCQVWIIVEAVIGIRRKSSRH